MKVFFAGICLLFLHSLLMSAERRGDFELRLGGRVCHIDSRFRHSAIGCTWLPNIRRRAYSGQIIINVLDEQFAAIADLHFKR